MRRRYRRADDAVTRTRRWLMVAALGLVYFAEGFDIFMVGKIAPVIANSFAAPAEALAPVIIAHQVGLAVGAIAGGLVADRIGRVASLTACLFLAGLVTLTVPLAHSIDELVVLRGLAGAFLGGAAPAILALATVAVTPSWRTVALTIVLGCHSLGAAAGSLVALFMIGPIGWQSGFTLAAVLLFATIGPAAWFARDLGVAVPGLDGARATIPPSPRLFILGLCFFLTMGCIAMLNAWLPSLFDARAAIAVDRFAAVGVLAGPAGLVGMLIIGWLARHIPLPSLTMAVFAGHAAALAGLAFQRFGTHAFVVAFVVAAFAQAAGQGLLNIVVAQSVPDEVRAAAFGVVGAVGRTGGIVGPWIGALALAGTVSLAVVLATVALIIALVGALLATTLNQVSRNRLYLARTNS